MRSAHAKAGTSGSTCGHGYACVASHVTLKAKSMLEKVHLKGSMAVGKSVLQQEYLNTSVTGHKVRLEHLKACDKPVKICYILYKFKLFYINVNYLIFILYRNP